MNIAFFLTPKKDVVYLDYSATMRQALEKMEYHTYTAIPLIDKKGRYVGTLTEGDLLWTMKKEEDITFKDTSKILVKDIPRKRTNKAVSINSDIQDLIYLAKNQNFVPVVDDSGVFIGIITRSDIINYCYDIIYAQNPLKEVVL